MLSNHDQSVLSFIFDGCDSCEHQSNRKLSEQEQKAAVLEAQAIQLAESEKKDYEGALKLLNEALRVAPSYPSIFNNRAQLQRLQGSQESALSDLDGCIDLCKNDQFPQVQMQAHLQRAWILYEREDEQGAFNDFQKAAKLGSSEARMMAVKCNPYAQLCNAIVQQQMNPKQI